MYEYTNLHWDHQLRNRNKKPKRKNKIKKNTASFWSKTGFPVFHNFKSPMKMTLKVAATKIVVRIVYYLHARHFWNRSYRRAYSPRGSVTCFETCRQHGGNRSHISLVKTEKFYCPGISLLLLTPNTSPGTGRICWSNIDSDVLGLFRFIWTASGDQELHLKCNKMFPSTFTSKCYT